MKVLKFGGSSVATADAVRRVAAIVAATRSTGEVAVVVSALGGATDLLLAASRTAADGGREWTDAVRELRRRHLEMAHELLAGDELAEAIAAVDAGLAELGDLLHGVTLLKECSPRSADRIAATGELLSSPLVAAALRAAGVPAIARDSRPLVLTDRRFGGARVVTDETSRRLREALADLTAVPVITGFLGATDRGATTTLGRGGSDLTASLVGVALGAEAVELWTDVDGVLSADPRLVPGAFPVAALSYDELMELSHFGAKVVYPPTVHPARAAGIPLVIRNTFRPEAPGTRITAEQVADERLVRGLASIPEVALLRLEGDGMVGVPGIARRLFGVLADDAINVILISQASSEHSICLAVSPEAAEAAREAVDAEFSLERRAGLVEPLVVERELSVVAIVGQGMCRSVGIAGQLFGELGEAGVNVRAIAQGSSELNISLVVARGDEARALNAIHRRFFFPHTRRIELVLAGVGTVGRALLAQLPETAARARERGLELALVGLATSRTMALEAAGLDPGRWREALEAGRPSNLDDLAAFARAGGDQRVLVDCTASDAVPERYLELLEGGVSVVGANKRPFGGPLARWRALGAAAAAAGVSLLHEATVGAGLPVLSTLTDLVRTGDRVHRIDGVLSGTFNFVLDRVMAGTPLSAAVHEAHAAGLTEPHPADDLGGLDVARKLLILARTAGFGLEPEDVEVRGVLPDHSWTSLDLETFWRRLPELDGELAARATAARAAGGSLTFLATVTPAGARVEVATLPLDHPAAGLRASENLVAFTTDRYRTTPLVVRGPGAGPEVTAAGVLADVLRTAAAPRRS